MNQPDQPEQIIDRTLDALRRVEPPLGIEHRILETLDQATLTREAKRAHSGRPAWLAVATPRTFSAIACTLAIAALAFALVRHTHHAPTQAAIMPHPTPTQNPPSPLLATAAPPPLPLQTLTQPRRAAHHVRSSTRASSNQQPAAAPKPFPLTEQERLLQQIAHSGDPSQLAMLNPDLRAREEAKREAEFRQFLTVTRTQNP